MNRFLRFAAVLFLSLAAVRLTAQQPPVQQALRVPVTAKAKYVKVIVYDPGSDRTGSISLAVK